jgi:hypothetical protein
MFILDKGQSSAPAKRICNDHCTVREECGEHGKSNGELGVWGGEVLRGDGARPVEVLVELENLIPLTTIKVKRRRNVAS